MRVLHLVAADRWTGAAAVALAQVEALRAAGADARLLFRRGHNLEPRLARRAWASASWAKERRPAELRASIAAIRAAAAGCAVVHAHLPHDHALARVALRGRAPALVRSLHHASHLRRDPFQRWLLRAAAGIGLAHSEMAARGARFRPALPLAVLPPIVEPRFRPGTAGGRGRLGVPDGAFVAGTVGKLAADRGQDLLLRALSACPLAHGLIVGAGAFEKRLRRLAVQLGVAERVVFAGYVEDDLEALYAAMDVFVFPAAGSDHGHRAIAEAAACGVPALAADLPGVRDLVVPGVTGDLYPQPDAAALAVLLDRWSTDPERRAVAGAAAAARAAAWRAPVVAAAILSLYDQALVPIAPGRRHAV